MKATTLPFLALLLLAIPKSEAKAKSAPVSANVQHIKKEQSDSIRVEFNAKKKNTAQLVSGKSAETILNFYEFYLQERDQSRADSLIDYLLTSTNTINYRHQISLLAYQYTLDTKAPLLFLSDTARLKEYRTYFIKYDRSSLKSNRDLRAHFYDMVALDSAYYSFAPDSLIKKQMGHHYNSLAWYSIITQQLDQVEYYLKQSMKFDPQDKYPYSNMPLLLLLKGRYPEARALFIKLKDQPFDGPGSTFKDEFLEDFKLLEAEGITNRDTRKIVQLLNAKPKP